jgi:RHS repeat-associated protein
MACIAVAAHHSFHVSAIHISRGRLWRRWGKILLLAPLLLCLLGTGSAQIDPAAGILPFSTQAIGGVDLGTSNIHLNIPVRSKPGYPAFSFSLEGNSHVWKNGPQMAINYGLGVALGNAFWGYGVKANPNCYKQWYVQDSTGALHSVGSIGYTNCQGYPPPKPHTTIDGSGYTMVWTAWNAVTVYDKSGNQALPGGIHQFADFGIQTPDGTSIAETLSGSYIDSLNTTALTVSYSGTYQSQIDLSYSDVTQSTQHFTVIPSNYNLQSNFGCPGESQYLSPGTPLPSSLTTPAGNYYFYYEPTPGYSGYTTGRLAKIVFPSGGSISYGYSGGSSGVDCNSLVVPTLIITIADPVNNISGTWTYVNNDDAGGGNNYSVTETDPAGNQTVYNFSTGAPLGLPHVQTQAAYYQGTATGTPLKTVVTCYNGNFSSCVTPSSPPGVLITQTDVYTSLGSSSPSLVETLFDTYGNVTAIKKWGFGATYPPSGTPVSETDTKYANVNGVTCGPVSTHIFDRPCSVTTYGSGVMSQQVNYTYNSTGHPTQTSTLVAGSAYLTSFASYNSNGTTATATDVNGAVTNYYYNGTGGCNNLLLTSTVLPVNSLTTSQTWDCNGGVVTESTDANSKDTDSVYNDPLWRITSFTDQLENPTNYRYSPTAMDSTLLFNNSTVETGIGLDGLGRKIVTNHQQAPGSSTWDTYPQSYDSNGRVSKIYMPCATAAWTCPTPYTSITYDALNRPFVTTDGGGGTITKTYPQNDVVETVGPPPSGVEHVKSRQYEYDGLGRLSSVCEILASGGSPCNQSASASGYKTSYTYSVPATGGSQMVVTQGSQTRTYVYDALGRLIKETNPESGTTTYLYDSVSSGNCGVNNPGDMVLKVDAVGNGSCYVYDSLHRLLSVGQNPSAYAAVTPDSCFLYDSATVNGVVMSNTKGHLAEAYTVAHGAGCNASKVTDEGFSYDARGQMTDVWEKTPNSGGYYHTAATYWANGMPASLSGVPGLSGWTFGPDGEGRPSSVTYGTSTNWVTGTTYYPSNPQTTVTFGTGDTDVYGYDGNTGRMNSFQFKVGSTPKLLTATPGWNANGTLGSLAITDQFNSSNTQTCTYVHDDLSRIQSVNCANGPTNVWGQNFSFDAYGNISKSVPSGSTGISFLATYSPSPSTNQFTLSACTVTYDANGNLTNDCANTYTWDAYGNASSVNSNSLTYDALGRAVEIASGSAHTQVLYSPIGKLGLMNGQTAKTIRIPLPGGSTAELLGPTGGTTHILHSEWLGSARLSTDYTARTMAYDVAYAPYGENYAGSGSATADLNFTGQSQDTASGLYDFLFRKYSPVQGRWLSPDPSELSAVDPTNPQTWNRYAYVFNNPLNATDPLGLFCVWDSGSFDSNDDAGTGKKTSCEDQGGTWFNGSPSDWVNSSGNQVFASNDWSGAANPQAAEFAAEINPNGVGFDAGGSPDASASGIFSPVPTTTSDVGGGVTPPASPCTSRNGRAYGPGHYARDYHLPSYGTPIPAPENGTVTGGRSNAVHIPGPYNYSQIAPPGSVNFTQFTTGSGYILSYVHVHPAVPVGTSVLQGNAVGISDNSGRITGPHTHIQVTNPFGARIDPNSYFTGCQ